MSGFIDWANAFNTTVCKDKCIAGNPKLKIELCPNDHNLALNGIRCRCAAYLCASINDVMDQHSHQVSNADHKGISLSELRRNYALESLSEADAAPEPFEQFQNWFAEALNSQLLEPNAMTLATATKTGQPSARTVLLKEMDAQGFVFYTNYESQKGQELADNPQAALLFTWLELERQVRIEGTVEKVSPATSEAYFQSRPTGSQIGAWASPQSRVIEGRNVLEERVKALQAQYKDATVLPLPPFWGGYRLLPQRIEFWQGRESRLHDRIRYTKTAEGWVKERLAP